MESPMVDVNVLKMALILVNFIIFFLIIRHFFYGKINEVIKNRQESIENEITSAESKNIEAEQLKLKYEEQLASLEEEGRKIVNDARQKAEAQHLEIIKRAEQEAHEMMLKAQADIQREKDKAVDDIRSNIIDISILAAEKVVETSIDRESHLALIESFIDEVGEAK
jgi:F-type H+-transporting ATPase subunit b